MCVCVCVCVCARACVSVFKTTLGIVPSVEGKPSVDRTASAGAKRVMRWRRFGEAAAAAVPRPYISKREVRVGEEEAAGQGPDGPTVTGLVDEVVRGDNRPANSSGELSCRHTASSSLLGSRGGWHCAKAQWHRKRDARGALAARSPPPPRPLPPPKHASESRLPPGASCPRPSSRTRV